jgi:hypothetical protein
METMTESSNKPKRDSMMSQSINRRGSLESITSVGELTAMSGADAFKVIENWDKKVNKVRGVFNSLLHPSIMRMINDLFPGDGLAGAWKYLNDLIS